LSTSTDIPLPHTDGQPVTVIVARSVAGGREQDFLLWADRLTAAAEGYPGFLGCGLLRPGNTGTLWNVVYRFDTSAHLAAWEQSGARGELLAGGAEFMQTVAVRRIDGMDAWFAPASPAQTGPLVARPAKWKTFLMTAAVILFLQTLISTVLSPVVSSWPTVLRSAVVIIPVVALMTWVVMPRLSKWLAGWLYRGKS
jgi:antibiotic biosynthesis monooxygenase (ABM) superfamily enzyme